MGFFLGFVTRMARSYFSPDSGKVGVEEDSQ
jgi:hypothetical protein